MSSPLSVREMVVRFFDGKGESSTRVLLLARRLDRLVRAEKLGDRLDAWVSLAHGRVDDDDDYPFISNGTVRRPLSPDLFLDVIENAAGVRSAFHDSLARILGDTDGVNLFAEAGIPAHRAIAPELWERLMRKILPSPRDDRDLGKLLRRQFDSDRSVERFRRMTPDHFHRIAVALFPPERIDLRAPFRQTFGDSFRLLAARVQSHGLSEDLRGRMKRMAVVESPFYNHGPLSGVLIEDWQAGRDMEKSLPAWKDNIQRCREAMRETGARLETEGVSLDIVFSLEVVESCLHRMESMVQIISATSEAGCSEAVHRFFCDLTLATRHDRSIGHLLNANTRLLHRKIVERSGQTGEHYIAHGRSDYRNIWVAAAGGGLLTTLTAAMKMRIYDAHLPLLSMGLASGLNYATSFMVLHVCGMILATKQPAMTAARLAVIMRDTHGAERYEKLTQLSSRICHSQLAAALGNIITVIFGVFIFDSFWRMAKGHAYLDEKAAHHVFEALSPLHSGTFFYAALTGVILWAASLVGGWFDNWSVYYRLPQAIRDHPLRQLLGQERMERWADHFSLNIAAWGTNISLGFMLGLTPVIGQFVGLPLDVRHVTLSTGQLAFACMSLRGDVNGGWVLLASLGIASMFVLNLGVSFMLSLFTAARAYGLKRREVFHLLTYIGESFLRRPRDFLLPPRCVEPTSGGKHETALRDSGSTSPSGH